MQDQFSEMEHRLEEKENLIRELNSELLTISGELENVQARLAVLSQENEVLEGNLQANQVHTLVIIVVLACRSSLFSRLLVDPLPLQSLGFGRRNSFCSNSISQDALDISSREVEKAHEENETLLNEQAEEFRLQTEKMKEEMGSLEAERDTLSSQVFVLEEQVFTIISSQTI